MRTAQNRCAPVAAMIAALAWCVAPRGYAAECKPPLLPAPALQLVKPLIELRIKQSRDQLTDAGRWKGESVYTGDVERQFAAVLADRSPAGDEAVAYLLTVNLGEHQGEELICEVMNRGRRMEPLIRSVQSCPPLTGLEPLPRFVQGSGRLPQMALAALARGEPCVYDE